jgi:hypothetical protein
MVVPYRGRMYVAGAGELESFFCFILPVDGGHLGSFWGDAREGARKRTLSVALVVHLSDARLVGRGSAVSRSAACGRCLCRWECG